MSSELISTAKPAFQKYPLFSWTNFVGLLPWIYFLPTLMLDIFIVTVIIRTFKTPFYKLLACSLIWDAISWLAYYITFRGNKTPVYFSIYNLIPAFGWIPTFLVYMGYYSFYVHWCLSYMLTANRFLCCLTPDNYEKIWKRAFPIIILFAHTYPLMCTWHIIYFGGYCEKQQDYYRIDKIDTVDSVKSPFTRSSFYQLIVSAFYGLTSTPMNIYILTKIVIRRKKSQKMVLNASKKPMDAEMNLFMFTIVLFLLAGVFIACQTIFFFKIRSMSDEQVRFVIGMQLYAQDLYVCAAPWLLFMLSGPMRKEIRRLYKINAVDVATNSWNSPQANK